MPKVEGTVRTPDDTNNRMDGDFVLVTFQPENGEPITVEHYYDKGIYKHPVDFVSSHKKVTVKYSEDSPHIYTIYEEAKGDYSKYIAAALIGGVFTWFFANGIVSSVITFVVVGAIVLLIQELNARFAWLNFNSKREED